MIRSPSLEKQIKIDEWENKVYETVRVGEYPPPYQQNDHTIRTGFKICEALLAALSVPGVALSLEVTTLIKNTLWDKYGDIIHDAELCYTLAGLMDQNRWYDAFKELMPIPVKQQERQIAIANLQHHWDDAFQGKALEALTEKLRRSEENAMLHDYYSKSFDIIQSSGMGKSRLVYAMGETIITISFALRRAGETGYPPCDPEVYNFLMAGPGKNYADVHIRALAFLGGFISSRKLL
jgi:hypothetical protein